MVTTLSSKGQLVLPANVRRHPKSGLPVMVAVWPPRRKVSAAEIARLSAELL